MNSDPKKSFRSEYDKMMGRQVIAEFAGEAHVSCDRQWQDSLLLFELAFKSRIERRTLSITRVEARELAAVHAAEQVQLLGLAIELQLISTAGGRYFSAPLGEDATIANWRHRCAQEIGSALADGVAVSGELLAYSLLEQACWPSAIAIAEGRFDQTHSATDTWYLMRGLYGAGVVGRARKLSRTLQDQHLTRSQRACRAECRAIDSEALGLREEALLSYDLAATLGAGARASLGGMLVALELNRPADIGRQLEHLANGSSGPSSLVRALHLLKGKRELMGREPSLRHLYELERSCAQIAELQQRSARGSN
ncbi:MAG: hypothetical protein ACI9F9_001553 [Candidatus Paceibacteria bacterium]|jgi:hypothetical protein